MRLTEFAEADIAAADTDADAQVVITEVEPLYRSRSGDPLTMLVQSCSQSQRDMHEPRISREPPINAR